MAMRLRIRTLKNETFEINISSADTVSAPLRASLRRRRWRRARRDPQSPSFFLKRARTTLAHVSAGAQWQRRAGCGGPAWRVFSLHVFFRLFFFFRCCSGWSDCCLVGQIEQVKALIEREKNHPAAHQKLIYNGVILVDNKTVAEYDIKVREKPAFVWTALTPGWPLKKGKRLCGAHGQGSRGWGVSRSCRRSRQARHRSCRRSCHRRPAGQDGRPGACQDGASAESAGG